MTNSKKIILLIAALILVVVLIAGIQAIFGPGEKGNLVVNGDFERWSGNKPSGWSVYDYQRKYKYDGGVSKTYSDTKEKFSGSKSACIENIGENDVRYKQTIKVKPSSTYKISCYFKTDGEIPDGDGANISIYDSSIKLSSTIIRNSNAQWIQVTAYGKTGKDQKKLDLAVGLGGFANTSQGRIWIDSVRFEQVKTAPAGTAVQNLFVDKSGEEVHRNVIPEVLDKAIFIIMAFLLLLYIYNVMAKSFKQKKKPEDYIKEGEWQPGKKLLTKIDVILMTVMTVIYLGGALYNLGDNVAPQTNFQPAKYNDYVTVSLGSEKNVRRILYNCNLSSASDDAATYNIEYLDNEGKFQKITEFKDVSFYEWKYKDVNINTSQIRITTQTPGFKINEIGILENSKENELGMKVINNIKIIDTNADRQGYEKWFDEQFTVPLRPSVLNGTYFDEIYFPRTAYENLHNMPIYETTHPPLGKLIQAAGIAIVGMTPFGWRIMGTLFGAAMIPVMYAFAKKLFNKFFYAFFASLLIMFDFMHFAQTRLATIDSYATLFIMLMYFYMYDIFITKSYEFKLKHTIIPIILSGLFFGLGAATKWICLYAGAGLAILFFLSKLMEVKSYTDLGKEDVTVKDQPWYKNYWINNVNTIFWSAVIFFVVIPATIYILSYIPYARVAPDHNLLRVMLDNQESMYNYHSTLTAPHPYSSEWWSWPVIGRPIWYYNGAGVPSGIRETIASFGNPLVWWVGLACLIAALYIAYKKRDKKMIVVFVAFACQFLPWIIVTRAVFIYHYFSCVPFIILCIVYVFKHLRETEVIRPWFMYTYMAAVVVLFLIFYPAISGVPVPESYIEHLRIFPTWWF